MTVTVRPARENHQLFSGLWKFEQGQGSGNPAGAPVGSRHRQQLTSEFIAALLRDFRQGGAKAIERVRRTQPAVYTKIRALLVPREMKAVSYDAGHRCPKILWA